MVSKQYHTEKSFLSRQVTSKYELGLEVICTYLQSV
jgi:hypothetical protein